MLSTKSSAMDTPCSIATRLMLVPVWCPPTTVTVLLVDANLARHPLTLVGVGSTVVHSSSSCCWFNLRLLQCNHRNESLHIRLWIARVKLYAEEIAMNGGFDIAGFHAALDAQRSSKGLNWKEVSAQSGVSASTLTRMSQGRRPDIDGLALLLAWSGLDASNFLPKANNPSRWHRSRRTEGGTKPGPRRAPGRWKRSSRSRTSASENGEIVSLPYGFKAKADRIAVGLRRQMGLPAEAPISISDLAARLRFPVVPITGFADVCPEHVAQLVETDIGAFSASLLQVGGRRIILLNDGHSLRRQNSDLAHEIAHRPSCASPHTALRSHWVPEFR